MYKHNVTIRNLDAGIFIMCSVVKGVYMKVDPNYVKNKNEIYYEKVKKRKRNYKRNRFVTLMCFVVLILIIVVVNLTWKKSVSNATVTACRVVRVVDGDTIIVSLNGVEQRVRMIGVDCPESVSEDEEENSIYGQYASDYTKQQLYEGKIIYLTFDEEKYDQYNRLLAYIWMNKDTENIDNMYQNILLSAGYATAERYEPNTLYYTELFCTMAEAAKERKGLWADETFYDENCRVLKMNFILGET